MDAQTMRYRQLLKQQDWWYEFSDDHSVWRRGRDTMNEIKSLQTRLDPDYRIYNEYAPDDFKVGK